jgi:hypothetical protein
MFRLIEQHGDSLMEFTALVHVMSLLFVCLASYVLFLCLLIYHELFLLALDRILMGIYLYSVICFCLALSVECSKLVRHIISNTLIVK